MDDTGHGTIYVDKIIKLDTRPHRLFLSTNSTRPVAATVVLSYLSDLHEVQVLFATLILIFVYILIMFEVIHRTIV